MAAARKAVRPGIASAVGRRARCRQGGADARARARGRVQASARAARPTSGSCSAGNALLVGAGASAACNARRASSSTATCRTRRCRRAPGTTRTRSTRSPASAASITAPVAHEQPETTPGAHLSSDAAAGARQSVRLPSRPARDGAALPAGARALGEADRRRRRCIGWQRRSRSSPSATTFRRSLPTRAARSRAARSSCSRSTSPSRSRKQLRALEAGGEVPRASPAGAARACSTSTLLQPAAAAMGDSAGAAIQPAALARPRRDVRRAVRCLAIQPRRACGRRAPPTGLPPMTGCQVINHTPAGYALRQIDREPDRLRIGDLIALRVEGRTGAAGGDGALVPQHAQRQRARVRLRAPLRQSGGRSGAAGGVPPTASFRSWCCPRTDGDRSRTRRPRRCWSRRATFQARAGDHAAPRQARPVSPC